MLNLAHLPGAAKDEKVVQLLRRHWITLLPLAITFTIVVILPPAAYLTARFVKPEIFENRSGAALFVMGVSIFFLYAWLFVFQNFIDYYLDIWIVTNKRVLNIEQHGLFARTVSELRLHRVQDVTAEVHGFLHTMLDYGYVHIQTAGEKERFQFEEVPHPNQVAKLILDFADQERREQLESAVEEFGMPDKE